MSASIPPIQRVFSTFSFFSGGLAADRRTGVFDRAVLEAVKWNGAAWLVRSSDEFVVFPEGPQAG